MEARNTGGVDTNDLYGDAEEKLKKMESAWEEAEIRADKNLRTMERFEQLLDHTTQTLYEVSIKYKKAEDFIENLATRHCALISHIGSDSSMDIIKKSINTTQRNIITYFNETDE